MILDRKLNQIYAYKNSFFNCIVYLRWLGICHVPVDPTLLPPFSCYNSLSSGFVFSLIAIRLFVLLSTSVKTPIVNPLLCPSFYCDCSLHNSAAFTGGDVNSFFQRQNTFASPLPSWEISSLASQSSKIHLASVWPQMSLLTSNVIAKISLKDNNV